MPTIPTPALIPLEWPRASSWVEVFRFELWNGSAYVPYPMAGARAVLDLRRHANYTTPLLEFTSDPGGGLVLDVPSASVTLALNPDDLASIAYGQVAYRLKLSFTDNTEGYFAVGTVRLLPEGAGKWIGERVVKVSPAPQIVVQVRPS